MDNHHFLSQFTQLDLILPNDMIREICQKLDFKDCVSFTKTSKKILTSCKDILRNKWREEQRIKNMGKNRRWNRRFKK